MYGWVGKMLRVDLTSGKCTVSPTSDYVPRYLGGRGLAARIYWDEVPPDVGAFDPDSRLIFVTGPLQGTLAPTSGRFMVSGKAAQTSPVEAYCRSGVGGHWAPELKWAGFDAIIVHGRAPRAVYLWIHDGEVEIRDASHLWGVDPFRTQEEIWRIHGPGTRVMTIGKGGEKQSRIGIILTDSGDASGQGGYGGVMGSKNLKAVAVRGTGTVRVARPLELMEVTRYATSLFARKPLPGDPLEPEEPGFLYNIWGGQKRGNLTGAPGELWDLCKDPTSGYKRVPDACFACPIACRTRVSGPDIPSGAAQCVQSMMYMECIAICPELGYSKEAWKAGRLADYYGINAYDLHGMIPWLSACYDEDVLTEEDTGLLLDEIGTRPFIQDLVRKIAEREGFGDLLAEGCQRAAMQIGGRAEEIMRKYYPRAGKFGGYREHWLYYGGFPGGYAVPVLALIWVLDNRDGMVSHNVVSQLWGAAASLGFEPNFAVADDLISTLEPVMKYAYGSAEAAHFFKPDGVGLNWEWAPQTVRRFFERTVLKDCYVVCDVAFPYLYNANSDDHVGDSSIESRLYSAVTGQDLSEEASYEVGGMLYALERAIQAREGRTREDDVLHDLCFEQADLAGRRYDREDLERAKDEYYRLNEWDERGVPTKARLNALGLSDVAADLEKRGLLT